MEDDLKRSQTLTQGLCCPAEAESSTRERRNRPLVVVHTGKMKGKTTAGCGLALRAWAAGLPVVVFQFVKSGRWRTGEEAALRALGRVYEQTGEGAPVEWFSVGQGFSWSRSSQDAPDPAVAAAAAWRDVQLRLAEERHGFYLLDEFTYPMAWGWVDVEDVLATLRGRPGFQHVVITGRGVDPRLIELADLVATSAKVKHPMDSGRPGQRGIEW